MIALSMQIMQVFWSSAGIWSSKILCSAQYNFPRQLVMWIVLEHLRSSHWGILWVISSQPFHSHCPFPLVNTAALLYDFCPCGSYDPQHIYYHVGPHIPVLAAKKLLGLHYFVSTVHLHFITIYALFTKGVANLLKKKKKKLTFLWPFLIFSKGCTSYLAGYQ